MKGRDAARPEKVSLDGPRLPSALDQIPSTYSFSPESETPTSSKGDSIALNEGDDCIYILDRVQVTS